jgi:hypothetical protein
MFAAAFAIASAADMSCDRECLRGFITKYSNQDARKLKLRA